MTQPRTRKKCQTCGMMKLPRSFSMNKLQKDGRKDKCKACINQQARDARAMVEAVRLGWPTDLGQVFKDHPRAPKSRYAPRHIPFYRLHTEPQSSKSDMEGRGY